MSTRLPSSEMFVDWWCICTWCLKHLWTWVQLFISLAYRRSCRWNCYRDFTGWSRPSFILYLRWTSGSVLWSCCLHPQRKGAALGFILNSTISYWCSCNETSECCSGDESNTSSSPYGTFIGFSETRRDLYPDWPLGTFNISRILSLEQRDSCHHIRGPNI